MGEAFAPVWQAFTDMLGLVNWTSPWTWLVIVVSLAFLSAANR